MCGLANGLVSALRGTTSAFGDVLDNGTVAASGLSAFITVRSNKTVQDGADRVVCEPGCQRHINGDVHDLLEPMGAQSETKVDGGTVPIGNGNDLPYPGYVKEGTRYMTATPFLRSSLFEVRSL